MKTDYYQQLKGAFNLSTKREVIAKAKAELLVRPGCESAINNASIEEFNKFIDPAKWEDFIPSAQAQLETARKLRVAAKKAARPVQDKAVSAVKETTEQVKAKIGDTLGREYGFVPGWARLGVAINGGITVNGVAFDEATGQRVDMQGANLNMSDLFFALPVTKLEVGDMVRYNNGIMAVKHVDEDFVTLLNLQNGMYCDYAPEASFIGPKTYTKIFSPLSMFGVGDYGSLAAILKDLSVENIREKSLPLIAALGLAFYGYKRNPRMLDDFIGTMKQEFVPAIAGTVLSGAGNMEEYKEIPAKLIEVAKSSPLLVVALSAIAFKVAKEYDLSGIIPDFDISDIGATEILLGVVGAIAVAQMTGHDVIGTVKSFIPGMEDVDLPDVEGAEVTE